MRSLKFFGLYISLALCVALIGCGGGSGSGSTGGGSDNTGGGGTPTTPTITSISPTTVSAGAIATTLTVNGTGFLATTSVQVGGVTESTTYVSSTQVTATIPAPQLASGAQLSVIAVNGVLSSGSATSLQVTNPAPIITSIAPSTATSGSTSPLVTVTGTGFVPTTTIQVNGSSRTTTFVNATQVNAALTSADVASGGNLSVTAVNPAPGGGTSSAATFAVANPVPTLGAITPTSVIAGAGPYTITVAGANFSANATVLVGGTAAPTTFVSSSQLAVTIANQSAAQIASIVVSNPAPGGGNSVTKSLYVLAQTPAPVITQVSPSQFIAGSAASSITLYGTNFVQQVAGSTYFVTSTVLWNGTPLTTSGYGSGSTQSLFAQVPANLLTSAGTANITVSSTASTPATSNAVTVTIVNPPPPTLTSLYPSSGPINTQETITLSGTGFSSGSTVALNGTTISSKYLNSSQLTVTVPASGLAVPGNVYFTVTTPGPGGGTSGTIPFTTYIAIAGNDMVSNPADGLLYVSSPSTAPAGLANAILSIDPTTGNIIRKIQVGSNPNKLALSSDHTQLFVGLNGAYSVAQVDLPTGQVVYQFPLEVLSIYGNSLNTANSLAAVPGLPNSVAVYSSDGNITIYDSGIPRPNTSSSLGYNNGGQMCFGSSASVLYVVNGSLKTLTVGSTGITASNNLNSSQQGNPYACQYDNGQLYLTNGAVVNASTGLVSGTFYSSQSSVAYGPVVSDSALGRAFILTNPNYNGLSIMAFDEATFNPAGSLAFNSNASLPYNGTRLVRWGQNGLAFAAVSQLYVFQSPLVKDLSPSPADLALTLGVPSTATTGTPINYTATVKNLGPNQATGVTLSISLDSSLIVNNITAEQGSCSSGSAFNCNLGNLANGSSTTVTVNVTPTTAGTFTAGTSLTSVSYDSSFTNNQATASTTVTGSTYSMVPTITIIAPALVQAGSGAFTLTVNGSGFNSASTVSLGGTALSTSFLSATQLSASVDSSSIANYGWLPVTVSNPTPGGGTSQVTPLTIFAAINVPANSMLFDPYSRQIYASVPSAATSVTGNSIVAIDPFTAKLGTPVLVGSEPGPLAETSDGNYLYIGLNGANSLVRFDLLQNQVLSTIPLSLTQYGYTNSVTAYSLASMPGSDTTLAITTQNSSGAVGIFDISGNTGTFRTNTGSGGSPVFADSTHLYTGYSSGLFRYTVGSTGLTQLDSTSINGLGNGFVLANGIAYGAQGGIAAASTTPPFQLATLPQVDFYNSGISGWGAGMLPDPSLQKDFMLLVNTAGTWAYGIARYNNNNYAPEASMTLPTQSSYCCSNSPWTMARFGQDGIALLSPPLTYNTPSTYLLILLRGPFVAPQELQSNPTPTLASSSVTSVAHGSGNVLVTVTGTNFYPGMAISWNGSYRTTTILDVQHATVAIPASDLANVGTGTLTAANFGTDTSNGLTVTIN
jgi:trimeric autotransporter adhesin